MVVVWQVVAVHDENVSLNSFKMAKRRVNPEIFRSGITKTWPQSVKLLNYAQNFRIINVHQKFLQNYWLNKDVRKSLFLYSDYQRKILKTNPRAFAVVLNIVKKTIQLRRRVLLQTLFVGGFRDMLTKRNSGDQSGLFTPLSYWYRKNKKLKFQLHHRHSRSDSYLLTHERQQIAMQMFYGTESLSRQGVFPMYNNVLRVQDTLESVKGSTSLRRYQFNVAAIRPPRWTMYISLKKHSFKRSVGYITAQPKFRPTNHYYIVLLTQLNLALHWRSSHLFAEVLKNVLEQRRRVLGFLRIIHEVLNRLHLNRYQISYISILVTGSFGKLSRSRSLRLGRLEQNMERSVSSLSNPISYTDTQIWTIRGALGLRVWFFWEK